METIELKDVMNQLPVADLVKNLAGVDKNGVPSQFTMENIAAVVGEKIWERNNSGTPAHIDFDKKIEAGFYTINDLSRDTINPPVSGRYSCVLISSGTHDLLITVDGQRILGRFTGGGHFEWINIL